MPFRPFFLLILLSRCMATATAEEAMQGFPAEKLAGKTLHIGSGQAFSSIRQAIKAASEGDTLLIHKGLYQEGNILVDKPLTLIGQGFPLIDGQKEHEVLTIRASHVTVRGLHLWRSGRNGTDDKAGIKVIQAEDVTLEGNCVTEAFFAISLAGVRNSRVEGNLIRGLPLTEQTSGNGINLWKCDSIEVLRNRLSGHRDGIYFEFVTNSLIEGNYSENNIRYGLHFMFSHNDTYRHNTFYQNGAGVAVMYTKGVKMEYNHFDHNWGDAAYGLLLKDIADSEIQYNDFSGNTIGIYLEGSSRIRVQHNRFRQNGWAMRVQASCDDNEFMFNNFEGNTFDVATNGTLVLNTFDRNYWDKYDGYDLDHNGTGDVPYHPVTLYASVVEQAPFSIMLMHSFMVSLLNQAERVLPTLTPEGLFDPHPTLKPYQLP